MAKTGTMVERLALVSRTPMRRFSVEVAISLALAVLSAAGATWMHAQFAALDSATVMTRGSAIADDPADPRWFSVVCEYRGATGVLSRPAAHTDEIVARDILASSRESTAPGRRVPAWSAVHELRDADIGSTRSLFEQVHGWPMPMLYRAAEVQANAELREAARHGGSSTSVNRALLPGGAAIDVAFYAMAWLFLIRLPGSIRRAVRWGRNASTRRDRKGAESHRRAHVPHRVHTMASRR